MRKFNLCATGGTFDRLHKGHEALLSTAFASACRVIVGITSGAMVSREKKTLSKIVQPFAQRKKELEQFLLQKNWLSRATIVKLEDFAGPAKSGGQIDCIVATSETAPSARKVNALRKNRRLVPAKIILCPFVRAEDNRHISSTRIRMGQSSRQGEIYAKHFAKQTLLLTRAVLPELKKPLGLLVREKPGAQTAARKVAQTLARAKPTKIIVVGDVALSNLCKAGAKIDLGFSDLKTMRKKAFSSAKQLGFSHSVELKVRNPRSRVSRSLARATMRAMQFEKPALVRVTGEEDLAVLPSVLFAPLGSAIIYGQPSQGLVLVWVGEKEKEKIAKLVSRFARQKS